MNEEMLEGMEELEAVRAENDLLRKRLICCEKGIPAGLVDDIICIASASGGEDFGAECDAAFMRMKAAVGSEMTTGVKIRKAEYDNEHLRRAFGLRK